MTGETVAFAVLALVLVGSALMVVLSTNLFHAVLWLALALTGTAGVFLLLDAEFLAAVQLLLYAGGIVTIAPGKGGLATFAPPLDAAGNSVRGQLVARFLSRQLGLNVFASQPAAPGEERDGAIV